MILTWTSFHTWTALDFICEFVLASVVARKITYLTTISTTQKSEWSGIFAFVIVLLKLWFSLIDFFRARNGWLMNHKLWSMATRLTTNELYLKEIFVCCRCVGMKKKCARAEGIKVAYRLWFYPGKLQHGFANQYGPDFHPYTIPSLSHVLCSIDLIGFRFRVETSFFRRLE